MGLYGMRSAKDAVMFRIANAAYNYGLTRNMMTAIGLILGVASGVLFALNAISFAFAPGFLRLECLE
jgi:hypothetical protein